MCREVSCDGGAGRRTEQPRAGLGASRIKLLLPQALLQVEWYCPVLLSALSVLHPPCAWVNPAFYRWHYGAFTKRIRVNGTGREQRVFPEITTEVAIIGLD